MLLPSRRVPLDRVPSDLVAAALMMLTASLYGSVVVLIYLSAPAWILAAAFIIGRERKSALAWEER